MEKQRISDKNTDNIQTDGKNMRFMKSLLFCLGIVFISAPMAWSDFGNWFVVNKRLSTNLDSSEKELSYRFTCQADMNITAAAVYCMDAIKPPAYIVGLQEDNNGIPSGEFLTFS